jgi:preprotein translocase subunit SecF
MRRKMVVVSFFTVIVLLAVALILTIYGSMFDHGTVLNVGIMAWLVTSAFIFLWLILLVWTRVTRYGRKKD